MLVASLITARDKRVRRFHVRYPVAGMKDRKADQGSDSRCFSDGNGDVRSVRRDVADFDE